jgi:hypothetical protein
VTGFLARLFGPLALSLFCDAASVAGVRLSPEAKLCSVLSSLARLDAARVTSPGLGSSPWWAAEAAVLAGRAGLRKRALADAQQAVHGLGRGRIAVSGVAARTAMAVAEIASAAEPDAVRCLRERMVEREPGESVLSGLDVATEVRHLVKERANEPGPHWILDPGRSPGMGLRLGLTPQSDLLVHHERNGRLAVQAMLVPGANWTAERSLRVRLVDPGVRRVLARTDFCRNGAVIQALLALPFPKHELGETWIEVVEADEPSVASAKAHWIGRAVRWADTALRAERAPVGLAPQSTRQDWAALAALGWERCRRDWEAAGDHGRAEAVLAARTPLTSPRYLAEVLGGPSGWLQDDDSHPQG